MENDFCRNIQQKLKDLAAQHDLSGSNVYIESSVLTVKEAIGSPRRNDFPLQKGKEKLMQACCNGYYGQAYTDMPDNFSGTIQEVVSLPLKNNYQRAVLVSSFNAVLRSLNLCGNTIHCKDCQPEECSGKLVEMIKSTYGNPKIALFGFQPAMAEALAGKFDLRIFDLDPENIGRERFGVTIENGNCRMEEVQAWADLVLVTGSTICNGTLSNFLSLQKPVVFYGTTIAGTASAFGLNHFCPESS